VVAEVAEVATVVAGMAVVMEAVEEKIMVVVAEEVIMVAEAIIEMDIGEITHIITAMVIGMVEIGMGLTITMDGAGGQAEHFL
jgi:hypothetical protein